MSRKKIWVYRVCHDGISTFEAYDNEEDAIDVADGLSAAAAHIEHYENIDYGRFTVMTPEIQSYMRDRDRRRKNAYRDKHARSRNKEGDSLDRAP